MPEPVRLVIDDHCAAFIGRCLRLEGFFPEFRAEHVSKVFPRSGLYEYPHGFTLIEQGETGRDVFLIYAGAVEVSQSFGSAAAALAKLESGDLLGEVALLRDGVRSATAVVVGSSQIYRLSYDDVGYILSNNPELAEHLKGLAAARQGR